MHVNSSLLQALLSSLHWNRNLFLFKSAQILMQSSQFILPTTGDFFYSYLTVAQRDLCLFLPFQLLLFWKKKYIQKCHYI